jgi:hypothetical protein
MSKVHQTRGVINNKTHGHSGSRIDDLDTIRRWGRAVASGRQLSCLNHGRQGGAKRGRIHGSCCRNSSDAPREKRASG